MTDKQIKFCDEYVVNGFNGSRAYEIAFQNDNKDVCKANSWKLLRMPKIIEMIKDIEGNYRILGLELGIDRKRILTAIKDMLNATKKVYHDGEEIDEVPDHTAINNAIITWAKLTGEFEAEKSRITFDEGGMLEKDPSKMTEEERQEVKNKILKEI